MAVQFAEPTGVLSRPQGISPSRWVEEGCFNRSVWSPESLVADAEPQGFRIARQEELPQAHAFCEQLMNMRLAPLWALASAHAHTGASAWVIDRGDGHAEQAAQETSGVFLILPLNWDGEAALRTERFSFSTPRIDQLCAPGDEIAAMYFWFCGGADHEARRSVVHTAMAWIDGSCGDLRVYGRAASEAGAAAFLRLNFRLLAPKSQNIYFLDKRR